MSDAYIDGFVKTALAFNVDPVALFRRARGLVPRIGAAVRGAMGSQRVGNALGTAGKAVQGAVNSPQARSALDAAKEFMRGRTMLLPLSAVPLVAYGGTYYRG